MRKGTSKFAFNFGLAQSLNSIGADYYYLKDYEKSLDQYSKAYVMLKRLHKGDHPDLAQCLNNIGNCCIKEVESVN